jgi:Domain of unknown function (DUF4157)
MFAPPVAKAQTQAGARSTTQLGRQHSTFAARSFGGSMVEQAQVLQRSGDDQAAHRIVSRDFSKIPISPPDRANQSRVRSSLNAPPRVIQRKLVVGQLNDPLESEADRVAEHVMRTPDPAAISPPSARMVLQRKCAACEEEAKEEPLKLTRKESYDASAFDGTAATAIVHEVLGSPGRALEPSTRAFFEPRFGYDFSGVRIHTDPLAAESAQSVGALAYTVGRHIIFGSNQYAWQTAGGGRLLAHELAHTIQQKGGTPADRVSPGGLRSIAHKPTHLVHQNASAAILQRKPDEIEMPPMYMAKERKRSSSLPSIPPPMPLTLNPSELCPGGHCLTDEDIYADVDKSRAEDKAFEAKATADRKRRWEIRDHGTKQQKWELEFEDDYPELKNVGARPGPRDAGIMTPTGVRVPSDPKDFLAPRPFYERKSSAFLAYQGFIHYAEIVEAGHDAAARELSVARYGGYPIPDDRLDLYAYTHWSSKAMASRKGTEAGLLVANVAIAAMDVVGALTNQSSSPPSPSPTPQPAQALSNEASQSLQKLGVTGDEIKQFANGQKVWGNVVRGDAKLVPYFQREGKTLTAGILGAHSHLDQAGIIRGYLVFRRESMALAKQLSVKVLRLEADVVTNTDELLPQLLKRGFQEIPDRPFSYFLDIPVQ